jgi:CheY-like chemotaxis protein
MEVRPLAISEAVEAFKTLISRTMPESIRVTFEPSAEDCVVAADASRLEQVFMNLSLNARDAMPEGGQLSFRVSALHLAEDERPPYPGMQPGDWARVSVSDTGTGIPPDNLTRIFEPFFTTKEPGRGSGLGLAQVYGIIKQHDGFIDVESRPGSGTTFMIFLPMTSLPTAPEVERDVSEMDEGGGETILVVEDDEATRHALYEILESLGYHLLVAQDGIEAIEIIEAESHSIDLVLSDMVMPHMGGRALLELVRERAPHLRMALITGYPSRGGSGELLRGVTWIQKPLNSRSLANLIHKALASPSLAES